MSSSVSVAESASTDAPDAGFSVTLGNFEGPFDLLLQLISKHQLDITEVALSVVTSDFIAYTRELEDDLEQTTNFLLIAATLLDLKTARLLPQAEVEDEEDLALLEARDLLFARLMQYRAFKTVAAILAERFENQQLRHPRAVTLEPRFATLLPEVEIRATAQDLADLAAAALAPKQVPLVNLAHLHAPSVSVREQAHLVVDRLRRERSLTFRAITQDAPDGQTKVARFLALLELFREGMLSFEQAVPLGELTVRWTGSDDGDIDVGDEFDEPGPADEETEQATQTVTVDETTGSDDDRD
ncbi:segregation/condensation protein A [Aeromicrobium senzhongii]|uniref:Segregation and condensation protein A n=1 Tax=Aeromicrobium senzhongii TaxID=2663859 RepID=A0ABX6SPW1_9ACTN|nr:ScpA family protein [Aeromicrobium senzhongii]MTB86747.1 segregation/condensation protein A [Aeromicrobium senzhongii]QNL93404.1 segregation/condensation protein A [Aeromicrobium senzhongii]